MLIDMVRNILKNQKGVEVKVPFNVIAAGVSDSALLTGCIR